MTLVASPPLTAPTTKPNYDDVTNSPPKLQTSNDELTTVACRNSMESLNPETSDSDSHSQSSNDDVTSVQCFNPMDSLVQSLGYPGGNPVPPQFGQVSIENSSEVHFGDKNYYQGPVNIRQIVYANGTPLVANSESNNTSAGKDNPGFDAGEPCGTGDLPLRKKGLKWIQNLPKHRPILLGFFVGVLMLFFVVLTTVLLLRHPATTYGLSVHDTNEQDHVKPLDFNTEITAANQSQHKLRIVSRIEWVAQPPINDTTPLITPVPYVIIHHTATDYCQSIAQCVLHVRLIQTFHIDSRGYYDIGYNFLVGGDGAAYEGRGWTVEGAHAFGYNSKSIGIAFIGTFISKKPPDIQIMAAKKLIQRGVELGYIKKDYKLLAARQLSGTESPGLALFKDMKTWPHWAKGP